MTNKTNIKSFCNQCVGETNHTVLHNEVLRGSTNDGEFQWLTQYDTIKCLGCDNVSLRQTNWHSEMVPDEVSVITFPPAIFRRPPAWLSELPAVPLWSPESPSEPIGEEFDMTEFIKELIHELYVCMQNDCRRSATMAVRALLEQVMINKVGDQGSFPNNMNEFQAKGFISPTQRQFLEAVIDAGSATMHRTYKPTKGDLIALVNIAESVTESAYVNEHRASQLRARIPPRKP